MRKILFTSSRTKEGWAYEPLPSRFYELIEELFSEADRDAYFGRSSDLRQILEEIKPFIFIKQKLEEE